MVEIKKLPPGEAIGARDLQQWAHRRTLGLAGPERSRKVEKEVEARTYYVHCRTCGEGQRQRLLRATLRRTGIACTKCGSTNVKVTRGKEIKMKSQGV
jgi:translation initiation factor 2 beta subunit (eIF-2beta)/eIF-5